MPVFAAWISDDEYAVVVLPSVDAVRREAEARGVELVKITELPARSVTVRKIQRPTTWPKTR